jgi:salicylate hydroxylase
MVAEQGDALIGADGLWSTVRAKLDHEAQPRFQGRTAWRAMVDADAVDPAWRDPATHLWLGPSAHLVHYPVRAGRTINIVAVVPDKAMESGWSGAGDRDVLLEKFRRWAAPVQELLAAATGWQTFSLCDLPPASRPGRGAITLLGDAAHPMLPFLAQGAAMAIEDAAVLADCMAQSPADFDHAFRAYEQARAARTSRAVNESARTGRIYAAPLAAIRNFVMRRAGGPRLGARQDWLYRWPH